MNSKVYDSAIKTIANDDSPPSKLLHTISNNELYALLEMRYGPAIAQHMIDDLIEFEQQKSVA